MATPHHSALPAQQQVTPRLIRLPEVMDRTGLGRSWVYQAVREGRFPAPIAVPGSRAVAWVEGEVAAWITQSIQASRSAS